MSPNEEEKTTIDDRCRECKDFERCGGVDKGEDCIKSEYADLENDYVDSIY